MASVRISTWLSDGLKLFVNWSQSRHFCRYYNVIIISLIHLQTQVFVLCALLSLCGCLVASFCSTGIRLPPFMVLYIGCLPLQPQIFSCFPLTLSPSDRFQFSVALVFCCLPLWSFIAIDIQLSPFIAIDIQLLPFDIVSK